MLDGSLQLPGTLINGWRGPRLGVMHDSDTYLGDECPHEGRHVGRRYHSATASR